MAGSEGERLSPVVQLYLKLRANVSLDGDLLLAERELRALLPSSLVPVTSAERLGDWSAGFGASLVLEGGRASGTIGYLASGTLADLAEVVRRASFLQQVFAVVPCPSTGQTDSASRSIEGLERIARVRARGDELLICVLPFQMLFEASGVIAKRAMSRCQVGALLDQVIAGLLDGAHGGSATIVDSVCRARSTTTHLTHSLHVYKAKFFPRMVRSLINAGLGPGPTKGKVVLDCFAGSGTALLEAALLGATPVGVDLDPLSALISRVKLSALTIGSDELERQALVALATARLSLDHPPSSRCRRERFELPTWLSRKLTPDVLAQVSNDVEAIRDGIAEVEDAGIQALLRVVLSDALTRKLRMRFLGTGVGRFALDLHRGSVLALFESHLRRMCNTMEAFACLRRILGIGALPESSVLLGDATALTIAPESVDLLVTSPPYLPASSGRETYSKGRAPSLLALDMLDDAEIEALGQEAVGSMNGTDALMTWPDQRVLDLVAWLQRDELRAIKALPTARYFVDMQRAFESMLRVLKPGSACAVVVAKEHQFYRFSTRETLYRVPIKEMLLESAGRAGFVNLRSVDVELAKSNRNARPRSLDRYFESILLMERPAGRH